MITLSQIEAKKEILRKYWVEGVRDRQTLINQAKLLDMAKDKILENIPPQQQMALEAQVDKSMYDL